VAEILDGRVVAKALKARLRDRIAVLAKAGITPALTLIRVGDDPASEVYVRSKDRACRKLGIVSESILLPEDIDQPTLLQKIVELNQDDRIHGILVQLPLPHHLSEDTVIAAIDPEKDVDGFHPFNAGLVSLGTPRFIPATPLGIIRILQHFGIETAGRNIVVLGRSRIVGRPMANLLSAKADYGNATVTVCHTRTPDLSAHTLGADIIIAAAGLKGLVTADMVSPGTVVIDVGIHRDPDPANPGKNIISGDVEFETVSAKAAAITPVPGGVGPMTVASLLENTVFAAEQRVQ
jgi:methylenetetrahydrofolate dehydrogenase (NADP+) / methenyltetrahydrofolate cyclohydrolase